MVYDELGLEMIDTTSQEDSALPEMHRDSPERVASASTSIDERLIKILKALDR